MKGSSAVRAIDAGSVSSRKRRRKNTLTLPCRRSAQVPTEELRSYLTLDREILMLRNPLRGEDSECLLERLSSEDPRIRCLAAEALGGMGPIACNAVPALIERLSDGSRAVRYFAAQALGTIGARGELSIPALVGMFSKETDLKPDSPATAAILSLTRIARHKPHQVLTLLWKEASQSIAGARIAAAKCLYAIGTLTPHLLEESLQRAGKSKLPALQQTAAVLQECFNSAGA